MKDLMGKAAMDYYRDNKPKNMMTETNISTLDVFPTSYLFRSFMEMDLQEQRALERVKGKVLDIGAGAGSHSLFIQDEIGLEVTALDQSPLFIKVCKLRGIKNTVCSTILDYSGEKFDTLLLLMNGTGIFEKFDKIGVYLEHLKTLLNPGGQILIDGSDIIYMYTKPNGSFQDPPDHYYGEVTYQLYYKGEKEDPFPWLYLDFESLKEVSEDHGLKAEKVWEKNYNYLAKLTFAEGNS